MSEEEIVALEERARKAGGTIESPFVHQSPFAPSSSLFSPHNSSSFQPTTSVPHISHITGSRYFGVDHQHVEEIVDERKCEEGQIAFDAARTVKVFHLCRESHEVPEQVQHSVVDDNMGFEVERSERVRRSPRA